MKKDSIVFIVGPTAVGKSEVAFLLAKQIQGEIVSADSMQIYKEINIASNKPDKAMLDEVPHHLIGIISVEEDFDVARFNEMAVNCVYKIHQAGHIPIVVGGSGMYVQVLLDGIFEGTAKDERLRRSLKKEAEKKGISHLYARLQKLDPQAAGKIHPNDLRRIIRALEVYELEHMPISELQKQRSGLFGKYNIKIFGLNMDRQRLYERIERRVDEMFERGLIEEIISLKQLKLGYTADRMIGKDEVQGYLDGRYDLQQAKALMKMNTRRLAKRQMSWFRRDKRIQWLEVTPDGSNTEKIIQYIMRHMSILHYLTWLICALCTNQPG